jgi:hypothetical protein
MVEGECSSLQKVFNIERGSILEVLAVQKSTMNKNQSPPFETGKKFDA